MVSDEFKAFHKEARKNALSSGKTIGLWAMRAALYSEQSHSRRFIHYARGCVPLYEISAALNNKRWRVVYGQQRI